MRSVTCGPSLLEVSNAAPARQRARLGAAVVETGGVIDTAPLVFYLSGEERRLGREARRLLRRAESGRARLAVPPVWRLEVAQLEERGPSPLGVAFERWCALLEESASLLLLPLERSHVSEARSLPTLRDPFDRLIAGTAVALGVPLITPDTRIASVSRVEVVW